MINCIHNGTLDIHIPVPRNFPFGVPVGTGPLVGGLVITGGLVEGGDAVGDCVGTVPKIFWKRFHIYSHIRIIKDF